MARTCGAAALRRLTAASSRGALRARAAARAKEGKGSPVVSSASAPCQTQPSVAHDRGGK